jgi:hypothetical protein
LNSLYDDVTSGCLELDCGGAILPADGRSVQDVNDSLRLLIERGVAKKLTGLLGLDVEK